MAKIMNNALVQMLTRLTQGYFHLFFMGFENWSLKWSQVNVSLAQQISESALIFFASKMNLSIVAMPLNWQKQEMENKSSFWLN